ncbi:hypothetical protein NUM3379_24850 [Kineococcus sp. NUM-3379]
MTPAPDPPGPVPGPPGPVPGPAGDPGSHDARARDLYAHETGDGDHEGEEFTLRPYTVTGGRTRPTSADIPVEALVEAVVSPELRMTPERRRLLELTTGQYLSVAELSAHLRLPVGVVRVVVSDLSADGQVRIHGMAPATTTADPASTISVLESVLNGISSL